MKTQTHNDSIDELLKDIIKKEIDAIDEKFTEAIDQIKQQDEQ